MVNLLKSTEDLSTLGDVPVLNLSISNPNDNRLLSSLSADDSEIRPPFSLSDPRCIRPFRNVPVQIINALQAMKLLTLVFTPRIVTLPLEVTTPITSS